MLRHPQHVVHWLVGRFQESTTLFPTPLTRTRFGRDARRSLVQGVGPGGSILSVGIAGARRAEESVDHLADMADMADMAACETFPILKIDRL